MLVGNGIDLILTPHELAPGPIGSFWFPSFGVTSILGTISPPMAKVAVAATVVAEKGMTVADCGDMCWAPSPVSPNFFINHNIRGL
jgi:hypothetical protein